MVRQESIDIKTGGRGTYDITETVQNIVNRSAIKTGMCHVFVHHTSASLILCENADPSVRRDLESFMSRMIPDGDPLYEHDYEGPDDMPAHIRTVITQTGLTLPVAQGRCALGTWQGVYVWEHRTMGHHRHLTVTIYGE